MKLKNLKIKNLIIDLLICLIYPIFKACTSTRPLLLFSDTCIIIGLVMLVVGVINNFFIQGDLDITGFIANRALNKNAKGFDAYMKDQEAKRKDSFNYPLLCAFILLIIGFIASLFC